MSPTTRQLIRKLLHLWYQLINNSFVNKCNIPDLSDSLSKDLLISSKFVKNHSERKEILQQMLMNRHIARSVLYAHSRSEFSGSQDSSEQLDNLSIGENINHSNTFMSSMAGQHRDSIRDRRHKRLSLLCSNMSLDNAALECLSSSQNKNESDDLIINGGDDEEDDNNNDNNRQDQFNMRFSTANVSREVASAINK